ncbi:hypothetical protein ACM66B_007014 [Microbotryomycetes sp. NB124-2]
MASATATGAAPRPPQADYPPATSPAAKETGPTTSIDQDLNKSTQRLLTETLWTALTYLGYAVGAYIASRLIKATINWPFRLLAWSTTKLLWLVEKLFFVLAWITQWLSVIAFFLILIFILLSSIVLVIYKFEPQIRQFRHSQPVVAKLLLEAAYHVPVLVLSRYVWSWVYQILVVLALARLAANGAGVNWIEHVKHASETAFERAFGSRRRTTMSDINDDSQDRLRPIREAVERAERERAERLAQREQESSEADKWTRQWQEQMVNEGLRKRAQRNAAASASTETGTKDSDGAGAEL